ncbi:hypothetical protein SAMN05216358_0111 [Rhizobium sp. AN5]|uniref:hypothetical protein n=1 Tax=Rhizobium sp. AN5 TaxID=1855304 RepID=UPI000BD40035|nr:hypothetical protein [Rhizobium sp. AN5]SOC90087.1 hypothetical protein SAMN05216358_0111 [Rhizobium sp. AN5]
MGWINERYCRSGSPLPHLLIEDVDHSQGCNNGGLEYFSRNGSSWPYTVAHGIVDVTDVSTKYYKTTIVGERERKVISCTKNSQGNLVNIRRIWAYGDTNYVPANYDNPWDVMLIQLHRNSTYRNLYNLHARQILVEIRKPNGRYENRVLGPKSRWGESIPFPPGWEITHAEWGAPGT